MEELKYRIIEHDNIVGHYFYIQREYMVNEGWLLWPTWVKKWVNLNRYGHYVTHKWHDPHAYSSLEEAQMALDKMKNPKIRIHNEKPI